MQFAGQKPSPDQALTLLPLIEGVEVKNFAAPYGDTGKPLNIDLFNLNWGQFVGPIPSRARLTTKMIVPVDARDPRLKALVDAGLDKAAIDLDVGAAWTETSGIFVLEPVTLDVGGYFKASARVSLVNVPKGVFSVDPTKAMAAAAQLEAGAVELTLHDAGSLDSGFAQFARIQNFDREAARQSLVDQLRTNGEKAAAANPEAAAAVEAVARFVETSGQTLTIKLTPRGKVPVLQLIQAMQTDPLAASTQFKIEASTGL
jgi:hypothetical protein